MFLKYAKECIVKIGVLAATLQGISWMFGVDEAVRKLLADNWLLTLICIAAWCFWNYIIWDAPMQLEKIRYQKKLEGSARRRRRP